MPIILDFDHEVTVPEMMEARDHRVEMQRSIIEKIFTLPDNTVLCSGHSEQTTVGTEKRRYRY
jgi:hypothetical protein